SATAIVVYLLHRLDHFLANTLLVHGIPPAERCQLLAGSRARVPPDRIVCARCGHSPRRPRGSLHSRSNGLLLRKSGRRQAPLGALHAARKDGGDEIGNGWTIPRTDRPRARKGSASVPHRENQDNE